MFVVGRSLYILSAIPFGAFDKASVYLCKYVCLTTIMLDTPLGFLYVYHSFIASFLPKANYI